MLTICYTYYPTSSNQPIRIIRNVTELQLNTLMKFAHEKLSIITNETADRLAHDYNDILDLRNGEKNVCK